MLIRFEVSNHRSIKEPVELSMVAVDVDRAEARAEAHLGVSLLPVAAIYGPNASGKSNLLDALAWLRNAVTFSLRAWERSISVEPFAFGGTSENPTSFNLEMSIDGIRFDYLLDLDHKRVLYEGLFHYPEKKRRRIFERDKEGLRIQRGLGALSGVRKLINDRTLVLSAARKFEVPLVSDFSDEVESIQTIGTAIYTGGASRIPRVKGFDLVSRSTIDWFDGSSDGGPHDLSHVEATADPKQNQALALLRLADFGIAGVTIEEKEFNFTGETRTERLAVLLHDSSTGPTPLDFLDESDGTKTWFKLVGPVLQALNDGTLVLLDELDASLHPVLSTELIRLFHSPVTNPKGAQLVFTSHDTSLLNHLNRDEIWLTEKRPDGSTRLGSLAKFAGERVRKSQNLENAYLHGRFGALPQINQYELLRALNLVG
ncbi:MAG: AAA family ATPase [Propionibacteriaceae bacterium]|jgi:energy-coupling factor transporter ATP-binding protein EcfA2|nr:AAA family ATPase [Propionibacteriaceae bacterium]